MTYRSRASRDNAVSLRKWEDTLTDQLGFLTGSPRPELSSRTVRNRCDTVGVYAQEFRLLRSSIEFPVFRHIQCVADSLSVEREGDVKLFFIYFLRPPMGAVPAPPFDTQ
jgi:hypothetical protein